MLLDGAAHDARLARWVADLHVDDEVGARRRRRSLEDQAGDDTSVAGVLAGLAEARAAVVLDVAGDRVRGEAVGAGTDFVAVRGQSGGLTLVVVAAIETVHADGVNRVPEGASMPVALLHLLGPVSADRPEVAVRVRSGSIIGGVLRRVGVDVLGVESSGRTTWVPAGALAFVRVSG